MFEKLKKLFLPEFGKNYPKFKHKGREAVRHLLKVKKGQVASAFQKEIDGVVIDIDLAWGKSYQNAKGEWKGFGLSHIFDKRKSEFLKRKDIKQIKDKQKADKIATRKVIGFLLHLDEIIESAKVSKVKNNKLKLQTSNFTIILGQKSNRKYIITGYIRNKIKNKMSLENHQTVHDGDFTSKSVTKLKDSDILLQNQRGDYTTKNLQSQDQNENFKDKIMKKFEQGISERKENTQKALNLDLVKDLKAKPNSSDDLDDIVDEVKSKENKENLENSKNLENLDNLNQNNLGGDKFKKPPRP